MVNEAERFAGEDKSKREAVETKNNAESMVYQTEKQIKELGDKVSQLHHFLDALGSIFGSDGPVGQMCKRFGSCPPGQPAGSRSTCTRTSAPWPWFCQPLSHTHGLHLQQSERLKPRRQMPGELFQRSPSC
jgi:hypothetical protein